MAVATTDDLVVALRRPLTDEENEHAYQLLERAERLLLARVPDLLYRVDSGHPCGFGHLVADIESEMVARVLRAPGSGIYTSEGEGEYNYSLNLRVASGLMDVLQSEWDLLGVTPWGTTGTISDSAAGTFHGIPHPWVFQYGPKGAGEGVPELIKEWRI